MNFKLLKQLLETIATDIFNMDTTGVSDYDNLFGTTGESIQNVKNISQKEYFKQYKKLEGHIEMMSPAEYLQRISEKPINRIEDKIENLKKLVKQGIKIPIPYLNYSGGELSQEGRHRAYLAKELGIEQIPVLIINDVRD